MGSTLLSHIIISCPSWNIHRSCLVDNLAPGLFTKRTPGCHLINAWRFAHVERGAQGANKGNLNPILSLSLSPCSPLTISLCLPSSHPICIQEKERLLIDDTESRPTSTPALRVGARGAPLIRFFAWTAVVGAGGVALIRFLADRS